MIVDTVFQVATETETTSIPVSAAVNVVAVPEHIATSAPPLTLAALLDDEAGASVMVRVSGTFTVVSAASVDAASDVPASSVVTFRDVIPASGTVEMEFSPADGFKDSVFIDFVPFKGRTGV